MLQVRIRCAKFVLVQGRYGTTPWQNKPKQWKVECSVDSTCAVCTEINVEVYKLLFVYSYLRTIKCHFTISWQGKNIHASCILQS